MNNDLSAVEAMCRRIPGLSVKLSGHGAGIFIYAHTKDRSFEVYQGDSNDFILEGWDHADPEGDGASVFTQSFGWIDELERCIREWISPPPSEAG